MVGNSNRGVYYSVSQGKIVKSYGEVAPEGVDGLTSRVKKSGVTVYEKHYDFIEGFIKGARIQTHEQYGDSIILELSDGNQFANLQIKCDSAYGRSFLYKIPNIEVSRPLRFVPYQFINKEGKDIRGINIFDGPKKVSNAYSRENPNGMPDLKKIKVKGKDTWDNTEQMEFLMKTFDEFIKKMEVEDTGVETEEDLPF